MSRQKPKYNVVVKDGFVQFEKRAEGNINNVSFLESYIKNKGKLNIGNTEIYPKDNMTTPSIHTKNGGKTNVEVVETNAPIITEGVGSLTCIGRAKIFIKNSPFVFSVIILAILTIIGFLADIIGITKFIREIFK